jgi:type II secretory pathway component PulF
VASSSDLPPSEVPGDSEAPKAGHSFVPRWRRTAQANLEASAVPKQEESVPSKFEPRWRRTAASEGVHPNLQKPTEQQPTQGGRFQARWRQRAAELQAKEEYLQAQQPQEDETSSGFVPRWRRTMASAASAPEAPTSDAKFEPRWRQRASTPTEAVQEAAPEKKEFVPRWRRTAAEAPLLEEPAVPEAPPVESQEPVKDEVPQASAEIAPALAPIALTELEVVTPTEEPPPVEETPADALEGAAAANPEVLGAPELASEPENTFEFSTAEVGTAFEVSPTEDSPPARERKHLRLELENPVGLGLAAPITETAPPVSSSRTHLPLIEREPATPERVAAEPACSPPSPPPKPINAYETSVIPRTQIPTPASPTADKPRLPKPVENRPQVGWSGPIPSGATPPSRRQEESPKSETIKITEKPTPPRPIYVPTPSPSSAPLRAARPTMVAGPPVSTTSKPTKPKKWWQKEPVIAVEDVATFTRQLSVMIGSGLPLHQALGFFAESTTGPLSDVIEAVTQKISSGFRLSAAMMQFPAVFSPVYTGLVELGETTSHIDEALEKLADLLEKQVRLSKRLTSALIYPAFLVAVSMGAVALFLQYVLPTMIPLFKSFSMELPWPTRALLFSRHLVWPTIFLTISGSIGWYFLKPRWLQARREKMNWVRRLDAFTLRLPLIGKFLYQLACARILFALSTMLDTGLPLLNALKRCETVAANLEIASRLEAAGKELRDGASISEAMLGPKVLPESCIHLIAAGEESAHLAEMVQYAARFYEEEVEYSISQFMSLIEPVIMAVMGVVVGFIVVAAVLPTVNMISHLGG